LQWLQPLICPSLNENDEGKELLETKAAIEMMKVLHFHDYFVSV
jgi:hypothetical protein